MTLPAAPTLSGFSLASPANDNNPELLGSAPAGTEVTIYATSNCTGTPVATGPAGNLASPGYTVSVADNSTTAFSATRRPVPTARRHARTPSLMPSSVHPCGARR